MQLQGEEREEGGGVVREGRRIVFSEEVPGRVRRRRGVAARG
jgi:hypothetical protein